ncbi:MAG TPA: N-acetyltransferase, partial [Candidatus Lokiarchaeia archaeon]
MILTVLTIRRFEPSDMFAVIKLASDTLPERYNPSLFNYFYEIYPQGFIVAEKAHKIIGFIVGVKINPNNARILMLSVLKSHRKQKIGTDLLKEFLKEISREKIRYVELEVRIDNTKAIIFYQKNGFKIKERISKFYQNG